MQLKEHLEYQEKVQEHLRALSSKNERKHTGDQGDKARYEEYLSDNGELVRRNGDAPLQEYYYSQCAPFAQAEIQKNDMYVQLQMLQE